MTLTTHNMLTLSLSGCLNPGREGAVKGRQKTPREKPGEF
jgi:hypothetical protein